MLQMRLIVGLGNPGEKYKNTRHNAGFRLIDKLAEGKNFSMNKKFEAEILEKDGYLLVKPQTFMNDSGRSVRKMVDFYKLSPGDVTVVHDDLDLDLGQRKMQLGVGPKVHNGINSVEESLGDKNFWRVRLGVDNRKTMVTSLSGADYVLENFGREEQKIMEKTIEEAMVELLIAMNL